MTAATLETRKNRTALLAFGGALAMLGLGYAAVPLYELFCQVTGFGGTTQRATESQAALAERLGARAARRFRSASMGPPRATCHGVSGPSR